jgi:ATP-binding cassette subfamily C protein
MASLLPLQNAVATVKYQVEQSKLSRELLYEVSANSTVPQQEKQEPPMHPADNLGVCLQSVSFQYPGSTQYALKNVSIQIESGQHIALIGPSGAGKTTIADLILGLIEPTEGSVTIGDGSISHDNLIRNNLISYVPQNPGIVSGSIAENVALGFPKNLINEELVKAALKTAHLSEFVESLPAGIWTSVGSQADALSGGQIQRLGLARALYGKPKIIVLDEATSALDASSEAFISSSLKELGPDVTVIVIAHRLSTVQHSDVVFVVENGQVTASGSFMHLRKTVPMVAEYVKLMSFEETDD